MWHGGTGESSPQEGRSNAWFEKNCLDEPNHRRVEENDGGVGCQTPSVSRSRGKEPASATMHL